MQLTIYSATTTLFLVMDPIGNIPVFMSLLRKLPARRRNWVLIRESLIAFTVLTVFLLFGSRILDGLHITPSALSIGGGMILFIIAIRMIFPPDKSLSDKVEEEPFIVPIAVPLIAGPSCLATVLLLATRHPDHLFYWFIAILISSALSMLVLLSSGLLMKILGERFLLAVERLMGMILTTLAVQMFLGGVSEYFHFS